MESVFEQANTVYRSGDYTKALELYREHLKTNPNDPSSQYNAGVCCLRLKRYKMSIKYFLKAIELHKEQKADDIQLSKYYYNLAMAHARLNDNKTALRLFNYAWTLNNYDSDCEKAIKVILMANRAKARKTSDSKPKKRKGKED